MKRTTLRQVASLAGAAALVAALVTYDPFHLFGVKAVGDEPPIRVRNGSISFELPAKQTWDKDADDDDGGNAWTPATGDSKGKYVVDFKDGSCGNTQVKGRFVVIELTDGTVLTLGTTKSKKFKSDKSMLTTGSLAPNTAGDTLEQGTVLVRAITVGWGNRCDRFTVPSSGQKIDIACISSNGKSGDCSATPARAQ